MSVTRISTGTALTDLSTMKFTPYCCEMNRSMSRMSTPARRSKLMSPPTYAVSQNAISVRLDVDEPDRWTSDALRTTAGEPVAGAGFAALGCEVGCDGNGSDRFG